MFLIIINKNKDKNNNNNNNSLNLNNKINKYKIYSKIPRLMMIIYNFNNNSSFKQMKIFKNKKYKMNKNN